MPTIRVAEADVSYRLTGAGAVTVVITQGLGFASAEWWPIQDALSKQARVLTWDRPGYGDSGPPRSPRTVANVAAEALGLIDGVAPHGLLVLVGHSQGGLSIRPLSRAWPEPACLGWLRGARVQDHSRRRTGPGPLPSGAGCRAGARPCGARRPDVCPPAPNGCRARGGAVGDAASTTRR